MADSAFLTGLREVPLDSILSKCPNLESIIGNSGSAYDVGTSHNTRREFLYYVSGPNGNFFVKAYQTKEEKEVLSAVPEDFSLLVRAEPNYFVQHKAPKSYNSISSLVQDGEIKPEDAGKIYADAFKYLSEKGLTFNGSLADDIFYDRNKGDFIVVDFGEITFYHADKSRIRNSLMQAIDDLTGIYEQDSSQAESALRAFNENLGKEYADLFKEAISVKCNMMEPHSSLQNVKSTILMLSNFLA